MINNNKYEFTSEKFGNLFYAKQASFDLLMKNTTPLSFFTSCELFSIRDIHNFIYNANVPQVYTRYDHFKDQTSTIIIAIGFPNYNTDVTTIVYSGGCNNDSVKISETLESKIFKIKGYNRSMIIDENDVTFYNITDLIVFEKNICMLACSMR